MYLWWIRRFLPEEISICLNDIGEGTCNVRIYLYNGRIYFYVVVEEENISYGICYSHISDSL